MPRVHLVTSAIVERTVARHGVRGILTPREQASFDAFSYERRREEWLAGRVAAKRAVRRELRAHGAAPPSYSDIDVWNDGNGAPRLTIAGRPSASARLSVSISHTRGAALAAVADRVDSGTIGVDIEPTTPLSLPVVTRVMSAGERERIASGDPCPPALVLWTAKEAAMKAASHLCTSLTSIELSWHAGRCTGARVVGHTPGSHDILVRHRTVGAFTAAVALCR